MVRITLALDVSAMENARRLFEDAGLIAPPVPVALQLAFAEQERWVFATREMDPGAMYMFDRYVTEAVALPVDDYVAISHSGHGANSYGLNYHLVYGPIAIFAQTSWGGVYMDAEASAADVRRQLTQCAELISRSCAIRRPSASTSGPADRGREHVPRERHLQVA